MRVRSLVPCVVVALCAALAPSASAAPPAPFGHACTPRDGALFCPTADDASRVPSFDGVPLDVDVWLPATGDGPFPTIAMLHGFGGSKLDFEGPKPAGYNAMELARKGYAVVLPSARGFGRSCGVPDSRTAPGCDAAGSTSTTSATKRATSSGCWPSSSTSSWRAPTSSG